MACTDKGSGVRMRAVVDSSGGRRADLAAIHVAKKSLAWDEDTYRDIMFTVCRVRSSADLDFGGRKAFLAHLQACLAKMGATAPAGRTNAPWTPSQNRLWSLWQQLADAKLVNDRHRAALDAWIKRQTGVDRIEWLNAAQLDLVIASAKRWLTRKVEA